MARFTRRTPLVRKKKLFKICPFCETKTVPSYKSADMLARFITERGKIWERATSNVCSKHQRHLSVEIKRARFLALLPFVVRPQ